MSAMKPRYALVRTRLGEAKGFRNLINGSTVTAEHPQTRAN